MPRKKRVRRTPNVYIDIADPVPRSPPKVKSEVVGVGESVSLRPTGTLRSPQRSSWIPLPPSQLGLQGLPGTTLSPTQSRSPRAPPKSIRKPLPQAQSGSPPESPYSLRASHPVTLIPVDSGESSDGDFLSSSDEYQPESDNDQSESDAVLWEESDDSDWEWTNIKTEPDSGMVRCESEDRIIYPTVSRKPVQAQKNKKKARNQTPAASKQISLRSSGLRTRSNKVYAPRLIDFSQRAHNGKRAKSHQHKKQSGKNSKRDNNPSKDFSQDSRKTLSSSDGNQEVQELEHHSDTADGAEEITEGGSAITDESQDQQESEGQGGEETGEGVEKHEERLSRKQSTATSTRRVLSYSDNICILVHKTSMKQKAWCAFCGRRVSQLMQHLLYKHMKEEEVIDIFNCGVNTYKRKQKLQVISDKGLCQHNAQVLEAGSGTLIPLRTPGNLEKLTLEQFCEGCYVFVEKNFVESHKLSCRRQNEQSMDSQVENNSDIEVLNVEPSSDDPLKITKDMIASVQNKLQQVSGNGQITILEKKHNASVFCVLCRITPCHFSRHMNQVHSDVPSVKKILEYPLGSKERKLGWTLLRNTFNFLHIREVLEAGSGQLMLTYVRKNKDPSQLKVCPTCYGLLFNIRPHLEKCQKLQPVGKVKSCECMLPLGEESSVEGGIPQTRANADQQEDQRHSASENRKNASEKGSINWQTRWDGKKKFRKINCCVYCQTPQYKMYKHYMQKHSSEEDVQKAIKYPKKSQQRRDIFSILILRGNNAHNKRILERGQGTLIPPRKLTEASTQDPEGELPGNLYSYCSECFARVRSVSMWAHAKRHRLLKEAVAQTAEKDNVRVGNRDNHLDGRAGLEKEKEPPEMLGVNNITSEREENVPCPQGDQNPATHGNPSTETVHQDRRESQRKQEEEGGREGQRKPEEEGGREGQRKPEEEGEREGQRKPEGKSGREGQGRPEEEGGREDQRKPEEEGGREGQGRPEEEGGREGQGKPEEEGGREGQRKPEEEGGREGQGKPEEEGGREGQGKPEEEGGREGQGKPEEEDGREGQGKPGAANGCSNDVVMVDRVQETLSGQEREGEETTPEDQTINATNKYQTGKEYCIIMKKRGRQKIPFVLKYSESLPILLSTIRSYCLFCDTSSINMIKHLEDKHAGEREVQEAIRMPREFDAGKRLWSRLITRGNKEHNDRAMQAGCGELIPLKRFQGLATLQNYQFCFCCYMFIRKSQTMHKYFCKKSRRIFDDSEKEDLIQRRRAVENKNMCICKARSTSEATSETAAASREQQHSRRKSATNFHLKSDNAISFNQWQNRERRIMTKSNCCLYCQSLQTSMARHMVKKHSNEKEVKEALKHPKKSKVRRDVFSGLLRRGNYQHNQRVAHLGKGFVIPVVFRHQRVGDLGRYTHCDSCLGLFSRTGLVSHRRRGCHRPPGLNQSPQKMSNGREEPKSRHQPSRAASHQVKDLRCQADTEMLNASSSDTSDEEWDRTEFKRLQKAKQRRLQKRRLAPQDQSPEGAAQQEAPQGGTTSNQEGPTKAKRKMVVRKGARPWSSEELVAINSFFSDQIGELKVPGKQQCEAAKAKFAEALKGRDWRSIKFCVYNKIQTHRKQERQDGEDEQRTERASDRRPWTLPEVRAVEKHMQTFITDLVTPGKLDCLRVKRRCGAALRDRSWKQIKFYVYNRILKKRKMQNND